MESAASTLRLWMFAVLLCIVSPFVEALTASNTILILARDQASAASTFSGLRGYGIPYQVVLVPQGGITLPPLNASADKGNFGAIVVHGEVAYQGPNGFLSALTPAQWQELYDYQTKFGVRMVRIDVFPSAEFGTTPAIPGAANEESQSMRFTDVSEFSTAGLKAGIDVPMAGLWHTPATITNTTIAKAFAQFSPGGPYTTGTTAAVINRIAGRQQMVWFTSYATEWSMTSTFLQHSWIHWATRGLYLGFRRVYFSTQVDDMFLSTDLYQPKGATFRLRPADLDHHVTWQQALNKRLPAGSNYFLEIGHNGNGDIEAALELELGKQYCTPQDAIDYPEPAMTDLEFKKPAGTGRAIWPATPETYVWSLTCAKLDELVSWFTTPAKRDNFAHISHTFSHADLNNATYTDAAKEIQFNIAWMKQIGLDQAIKFSKFGLIPPAITGVHNGDAIRAWLENGVKYVVGDNTRPALRNQESEFWPVYSTIQTNGYAGLLIMPRWATSIYYNCDFPACTLAEWVNTSGGKGNFGNLLDDARNVNTKHLLGLHHDPFMFHQANLRVADVPNIVVNGVSQKLSLIEAWTETVLVELIRLVTWPVITLKHDDIAAKFVNRMTLDQCKVNLVYNYSADGKNIVSVTVTTADGRNTCGAEVPVTFPRGSIANGIGRREQVGTDPLTIHFRFTGQPVTFELAEPLPL